MTTEELLENIAKDPKLPTPPVIALRVLELASQDDCGIGDLCHVISQDASLSGKIIKTVNSAMYGLPRPVTSIKRALATIGIKTTRSLVLSLSLPEMLRKKQIGEVAHRYWGMSLAGAITARELSRILHRQDPDDDMAAGLLRDIGMVVLEQIMPEQYSKVWAHPAEEISRDVCGLEQQYCGLDHAHVTAFLLTRWGFPRDITEAIRHHHSPNHGEYTTKGASERARLLFFATRVSQLLMDVVPSFVCEEIRDMAKQDFGMDDAVLRDFMTPLHGQIKEFARILNVDIGRCDHFHQVLNRAAEELATLTVATNLDIQQIQEQKFRAEAEADHWRNEAVYDTLTKVFNRRSFEERLSEYFALHNDPNIGVGLIFIDLDSFKQINDSYGHALGDAALKQVADALVQQVRRGDIAARFGGDEFCILAGDIDELGLRDMAQRVWQSVNDLVIRQGLTEIHIGASIGAAYCLPRRTHATPEDLLAIADRAMYEAKRNGKNRITFIPAQPVAGHIDPWLTTLSPATLHN